MSFKKTIVSTVAAMAIFSGNAMAAAADGTGDYLLFPSYFANEQGWSTNLKVVNTNTTASVIAKVVVREGYNSDEKLDFLIYLSPSDVFEGVLKVVNGGVTMYTEDESFILSGVSATPAAPQSIGLKSEFSWKNTDGVLTGNVEQNIMTQNNNFGYVEVFGVAHITGTYKDADDVSQSLTTVGVNKTDLYNVFRCNPADAVSAAANYCVTLPSDYDFTTAVYAPVDNDDIYGVAVIEANNENGPLAMTYNATAIEDLTRMQNYTGTAGVNTTLALHRDPVAYLTDLDAITYIESQLVSTYTYVTHYGSTDGMDPTVQLANMPTKKYRLNLGSAAMEAVYTPRDLTAAEKEGKTVAEISAFEADIRAVGVNWAINEYAAKKHDQIETYNPGDDNEISGDSDVTVSTADYCWTEICYEDMGTYTSYNTGWVAMVYTDPNSAANASIDSLVMTAKKVGTTNVTNITKPQYQ